MAIGSREPSSGLPLSLHPSCSDSAEKPGGCRREAGRRRSSDPTDSEGDEKGGAGFRDSPVRLDHRPGQMTATIRIEPRILGRTDARPLGGDEIGVGIEGFFPDGGTGGGSPCWRKRGPTHRGCRRPCTGKTFASAWQESPFARWMINSAMVVVTGVITNLTLCNLAGYAFARNRFAGSRILFVIVLGTLMVAEPGDALRDTCSGSPSPPSPSSWRKPPSSMLPVTSGCSPGFCCRSWGRRCARSRS